MSLVGYSFRDMIFIRSARRAFHKINFIPSPADYGVWGKVTLTPDSQTILVVVRWTTLIHSNVHSHAEMSGASLRLPAVLTTARR